MGTWPVRVIRGADGEPGLSPEHGYRYYGLYLVSDYWPEAGRSGYRVWRFRLERNLPDPDARVHELSNLPEGDTRAPSYSTVQRIVRSTAVTQAVKNLYDHICQICRMTLETPSGPYAEGCHVVPRGKPHHGPDTQQNVLCLCPNCHVRFDRGAIYVADDLNVVEVETERRIGRLTVKPGHDRDPGVLAQHRESIGTATLSSDLVDILLLSLVAMFNPSLLAAVTVMLLLPNPNSA